MGFVNSVVADLQGNLAESGRHHERSQTAEPMVKGVKNKFATRKTSDLQRNGVLKPHRPT